MKILPILLPLLICVSCTTSNEGLKPQEPVTKSSFKFRSANLLAHPYPLPTQSTIMVDWTMSDGTTQVAESFRAWDMDHDGQFELLEVLSSDGKTTGWAMDFNADGKIDVLRAATHNQTASHATGNSEVAFTPSEDEASSLLQLSH